VCAGLVLILINFLLVISRTKRWTFFNAFRTSLNFIIGLALCLTTIITLNSDIVMRFRDTPWILPTICLTFFFILILNHLPHPPPYFFRKKSKRDSMVEMSPLRPDYMP
jgi:hypothetical protein